MTLSVPPRVSGGAHEHGHLEELRTDPIALMQRVRDECGDLGALRLAGRDVGLLSGAEVHPRPACRLQGSAHVLDVRRGGPDTERRAEPRLGEVARGESRPCPPVSPGDEIITHRSDGTSAVFRVGRVESYAKSALPTLDVYGDIDRPGIRLITCDDESDSAAGSYRDNAIAYADLVT